MLGTGMKVWLGAAAAVSGVGTLVYLMARSGRRRDTGQPSTAPGTHIGQKATSEGSGVSGIHQDTRSEKDSSHDRLNGHLPGVAITRETVKQSAAADPAEQNSHENPPLSKDTCTRESPLNVAENVSECVSVAENKFDTGVSLHVESEETTPEVKVPEAVTEKTSDSVSLQHPQEQHSGVTEQHKKDTETPHKDAETRDDTNDDVVLPSTDSEESNTKSTNVTVAGDETMCSDTNTTTLSGTTCHSEHTETIVPETQSNKSESESSHAAPVPVVEELSRCLIVKPQCDPSCHEHLPDTTCASSPQVSTLPSSETTEATLTHTEEAASKASTATQQQYTLVLKSEEDICISGKHIHDSSPTEKPTEPFTFKPEETAETNKEHPVTTAEGNQENQTAVLDHEQPSLNQPPIEEKCTLKESALVSCEGTVDGRKACGANTDAAVGETNDKTVESTPQEPSSEVRCLVETQIIVTPAEEEELTDSKEEESQDQDHTVIKQGEETEKKAQSISKEDKQEKRNKVAIKLT
ncbi:mucin-22-like isoform X2 [Portunus trituberculatus]|uniref:mucin-22-like isoform X2 n=1 Tax=Portunus trituberculatus TaxID=210409 RepID=UPI001E1CD0FF|nr:mucin-22-like isoform X2 [Portunus trituberculatus]